MLILIVNVRCCAVRCLANTVHIHMITTTITGLVAGVTAPPVTASPTPTPTQGPTGVALQCEGKKDCNIPFTPIYTIQGAADASPLVGQVVTTTGVVTLLLPEYEEIGYVCQLLMLYI
jgi:5'-nucleotidase